MLRFLVRHMPMTHEQHDMVEASTSKALLQDDRPDDALGNGHDQGHATPSNAAKAWDGVDAKHITAASPVRISSQRQKPTPIGPADQIEMEAITEGHLFKVELAK